MTSLFINYRQLDEGWVVALDQHLSGRFGDSQVFRDAKSIRAGEDYVRTLLEAVRAASLLVAVIGPNWLDARDKEGRRKLDDERDWVRRELAEAFTYGIPVVPILVGGAAVPDERSLPGEVAKLARCQYLTLRQRTRSDDLVRIGDQLVELVPALSRHDGPRPADRYAAPSPPRPADPAAQSGSLVPLAEQGRLTHALWALGGLRSAGGRKLYVELAQDALGEDLAVPAERSEDGPGEGQEESLAALWRLVGVLLRQPVALWTFLDIVGPLHGSGPDFDAVLREAEILVPRPLLTLDERNNLRRLLFSIEYDGVAEVYRRAFRSGSPPPPPAGVGLRGVLEHLENMLWTPAFVPPVLVFLEHVAVELDDVTADALRHWIDRVASRLQLDAATAARIRSGARAAMVERRYLVIQIQPDAPDPSAYLLSVCLQTDSGDQQVLEVADEPMVLANLRDRVDDLMSDPTILGQIGGEEELMIEFVLPRDLINHEVDQWRFGGAGLSRQIGIEYPVVVRSLERLSDRSLHRRWRRKWSVLQTLNGRPAREAVCWLHRPSERSAAELIGELLDDDERPLLALAYPPTQSSTPTDQDEYVALLLSGTPVAVWSREEGDPAAFRSELEELLDQDSILSLRERSLRLRQRAVRQDDAMAVPLGRRFTVLWDDPERLPNPQAPLRAPA